MAKGISACGVDKGKCYDTRGLSWRKVRRVLKSRRAPGIMIMIMDGLWVLALF